MTDVVETTPANVVISTDEVVGLAVQATEIEYIITDDGPDTVIETTSTTANAVTLVETEIVLELETAFDIVEVSAQGPIGVSGPAGPQGPQGLKGDTGAIGGEQKEYKLFMTAGVVTYTLPDAPRVGTAVLVYINGVLVEFTLSGVNLTITAYSPGTIDDTDALTVYYFL